MISTKPAKPIQQPMEPWVAMLHLSDPSKSDLIARALFTSPEALKARLKFAGKPANTAARHVQAAIRFLVATDRLRTQRD